MAVSRSKAKKSRKISFLPKNNGKSMTYSYKYVYFFADPT